jgi:hypothetical protein
MVYMDENGDAESNYTLLARKRHLVFPQEYGLYPVGVFTLKENDNKILVSKPACSALLWEEIFVKVASAETLSFQAEW